MRTITHTHIYENVFNYFEKKDIKYQDDANEHTSAHTFEDTFNYFSFSNFVFFFILS